MNKIIVEKKLGIPPDYQYKALRRGVWLQKNWHKNKFEVLSQILKLNRRTKVLDLGTGSGNFELLFSKKVMRIVGVDYNDEALKFLGEQLRKKKMNNVSLVRSDIRTLPSKVTSQKYDYVIIVDTIEHIKLKDSVSLIRKVKGRLVKGGRLIIITPNYKSLWVTIEGVLDQLTIVPKFAGKQHLSRFDYENLPQILKRSGYTELKVNTFNLFSYLVPFVGLNNFLLKLEMKYLKSLGCLVVASAEA